MKKARTTSQQRVVVLVLRGSREYRESVSRISRSTDIPTTRLFRKALAEWAASRGFPRLPSI
jgi:hypothetical protein